MLEAVSIYHACCGADSARILVDARWAQGQMESVRRAFVEAMGGAKVQIGNVIGRVMCELW